MCYLTIKEMANISEDVIIVTSRSVLSPMSLISFCYYNVLKRSHILIDIILLQMINPVVGSGLLCF